MRPDVVEVDAEKCGAAVRELADKAAKLSDTELGSALRAVLPSQPGDARALLFALLGAIDGALETVRSQA